MSDERDNYRRLWPASVGVKLATVCPGHVASDADPKVCSHCGTHVEECRDEQDEQP